MSAGNKPRQITTVTFFVVIFLLLVKPASLSLAATPSQEYAPEAEVEAILVQKRARQIIPNQEFKALKYQPALSNLDNGKN